MKDLRTTEQELTHTMRVSTATGRTIDKVKKNTLWTFSVMVSANKEYHKYHKRREKMGHKQPVHKHETKNQEQCRNNVKSLGTVQEQCIGNDAMCSSGDCVMRKGIEGQGGRPVGKPQGCIRREGASEATPEAVRLAVGGDCRPGGGYCRLQMPLKLVLAVKGTVAGHRLGALQGGGGGAPLLPRHPWNPSPSPSCPLPSVQQNGW